MKIAGRRSNFHGNLKKSSVTYIIIRIRTPTKQPARDQFVLQKSFLQEKLSSPIKRYDFNHFFFFV